MTFISCDRQKYSCDIWKDMMKWNKTNMKKNITCANWPQNLENSTKDYTYKETTDSKIGSFTNDSNYIKRSSWIWRTWPNFIYMKLYVVYVIGSTNCNSNNIWYFPHYIANSSSEFFIVQSKWRECQLVLLSWIMMSIAPFNELAMQYTKTQYCFHWTCAYGMKYFFITLLCALSSIFYGTWFTLF